MQLDPINLTKLQHPHSFVKFRSNPNSQNVVLGPDRACYIKDIIEIGVNNKIEWKDIAAEIKTAGNTITILMLDDEKTCNHFNNYPIFGKISHLEKCSDNGPFGSSMDCNLSINKYSL
jgi:hypothetical protein